jgi:hypothetical protein
MAECVWRRFPCADLEDSDFGFEEQESPQWVADRPGVSVLPVLGEFFEAPSVSYFGVLKRWTGAAWVKAKFMRWTGAAWVAAKLMRWTGAAWVEVDATGV